MQKQFLYSVERNYPVAIEKLWQAWVDPAALADWYSPTDLSVYPGSVENVAEVGGIWTVAVDVPEYNFVAFFFGQYTQVETHKLLAHTMNYTQSLAEFKERKFSPEAHDIVIEFEDRGLESWVKFSQFGELPDGEPARAQAGMESYFDNLGRFLAR